MSAESEETEINRLRREQAKVRRDEVFGGLSQDERTAYEIRGRRLRELERRFYGQNGLLGQPFPIS